MDTVTRFVDRQAGSLSAVMTPVTEAARTLSATASYLLSEDGRKASLLVGRRRPIAAADHAAGPVEPPAPRIRRSAGRRAAQAPAALRAGRRTRSSASTPRRPTTRRRPSRSCTAPRHRTMNWSAAYDAQRTALRTKRADDDRSRRQNVADAFMADKGMRAAAHPPPTPKTCYVTTGLEACCSTSRSTRASPRMSRPKRTADSAQTSRPIESRFARARSRRPHVHEEKKQFIAAWIRANGTEEEKARHASGVLPMAEADRSHQRPGIRGGQHSARLRA